MRQGRIGAGLGLFGGTLLSLATIGCGAEESARQSVAPPRATVAARPPAEAAPPSADVVGAKGEAVPPAMPRKIIYNAQVDLVVESVTVIERELARLVKETGGYISETDISSQSHVERRGTWKVRIPVDQFDMFVAKVGQLGELQRSHVDSQDVTMEYYDLEARIANKQVEEKRLLKHLDESTGNLKDILDVERELSRVRGEVEQMQGRSRYLAHQTALSTVTLTATEVKTYTSPESPTFATQVVRTFRRSVDALADFGKAVVLFLVAVAPWLPVVALVVLPLAWLLQRRRASR